MTYIDPPTIPAGMTCAEYRRTRTTPPRTFWARLLRRNP